MWNFKWGSHFKHDHDNDFCKSCVSDLVNDEVLRYKNIFNRDLFWFIYPDAALSDFPRDDKGKKRIIEIIKPRAKAYVQIYKAVIDKWKKRRGWRWLRESYGELARQGVLIDSNYYSWKHI